MRNVIACGAAAALMIVSAPAIASPCPKDRAAAAKLLESLPNTGKVPCGYPCRDGRGYDASNMTVWGAKPEKVEAHFSQGRITSVHFILPGAPQRYIAAFIKEQKKENYCDASQSSCRWSDYDGTPEKLMELSISDYVKGTSTLICEYELVG
jgi:hypothetical protein